MFPSVDAMHFLFFYLEQSNVIKSSAPAKLSLRILINLRSSDQLSASRRENHMRIILSEIITALSNSKWG